MRFAHDIFTATENAELQMLTDLNRESMKIGLKINTKKPESNIQ